MSRCSALHEMNENGTTMTLIPADNPHTNGISHMEALPASKDLFPSGMNGVISKCVEKQSIISENGVSGEGDSPLVNGSVCVPSHSTSNSDTGQSPGIEGNKSDRDIKEENGPSSSIIGSGKTGETLPSVSQTSIKSNELSVKQNVSDNQSYSDLKISTPQSLEAKQLIDNEPSVELDHETQTVHVNVKGSSCADKHSSKTETIQTGSLGTEASSVQTGSLCTEASSVDTSTTNLSPSHPLCSNSSNEPCSETDTSSNHVSLPSSCEESSLKEPMRLSDPDVSKDPAVTESLKSQESINCNESSSISIKTKVGSRISVLQFNPETISPTISPTKEYKHTELESNGNRTNEEAKPTHQNTDQSASTSGVNEGQTLSSSGVEDAVNKSDGVIDDDVLMEDQDLNSHSPGFNEVNLDSNDVVKDGDDDSIGVEDKADENLSNSMELNIVKGESGMIEPVGVDSGLEVGDDGGMEVEGDCGMEVEGDCGMEVADGAMDGKEGEDDDMMHTDLVETNTSGEIEEIELDDVNDKVLKETGEEMVASPRDAQDVVTDSVEVDKSDVDVILLDINVMHGADSETGVGVDTQEKVSVHQDKQRPQRDIVDDTGVEVKESNGDDPKEVICEQTDSNKGKGEEEVKEREEMSSEEMSDFVDKEDDETDLKVAGIKKDDETELKVTGIKEDDETELKMRGIKEDDETELKMRGIKEDDETELKVTSIKEDDETELKVRGIEEDETELKMRGIKEDDETELKVRSIKEDETELKVTGIKEDETELKVTAFKEDETKLKVTDIKEDDVTELKMRGIKEYDETDLKVRGIKEDETELKMRGIEEDEETELKVRGIKEDYETELNARGIKMNETKKQNDLGVKTEEEDEKIDLELEDKEMKDNFLNDSCKDRKLEEIESAKLELNSESIPKIDMQVDKDQAHTKEKPSISNEEKPGDNSENVVAEKTKFKDILKLKKDVMTIQRNDDDDNDAIIIDENDVNLNEQKCDAAQKPNDCINMNNNSNKGIGPSPDKCNVKESEEMTRKRAMSTDDLSNTSPKRSRLDSVITKLGDHIGTKNSPDDDTVVLMDSDEEDDGKSSSAPVVPPVTKETKEKLGLTVTSAALRNLILASLKSVILGHKVEKTHHLEERMAKMESANMLWKESAKHLEKSVEELTKFSKEIDKRRSQSQKLKHLSSRNVGVQVSVGVPNPQAQTPRPVAPQPPKPSSQPPKPSNQPPKPQHRSATLTLPPSFRINHDVTAAPNQMAPTNSSPGGPMHRPQVRPGHPQIRGMPPNSFSPQNIDPNRQRLPRNPQTSSWPSQNQPPPPYPIRPPGATPPSPAARPQQARQSNVVNLIDLTDEDDSTKKSPPSKANMSPNTRTNVPRGASPQGYSQGGRIVPSQHISPNVTNRFEGPRNLTTSNPRPGTAGGYGARMGGPGTTGRGGGQQRQVNTNQSVKSVSSLPSGVQAGRHPAPFPKEQNSTIVPPSAKFPPPKPSLKISRVVKGIVLSWNMPPVNNVELIASYQLFAYQESSTYPSPSAWKKVGDVKALPLPMACTLTQFQEGNKYFFAVRAVDQYGRWGEYSDPSSIFLYPDGAPNQAGAPGK